MIYYDAQWIPNTSSLRHPFIQLQRGKSVDQRSQITVSIRYSCSNLKNWWGCDTYTQSEWVNDVLFAQILDIGYNVECCGHDLISDHTRLVTSNASRQVYTCSLNYLAKQGYILQWEHSSRQRGSAHVCCNVLLRCHGGMQRATMTETSNARYGWSHEHEVLIKLFGSKNLMASHLCLYPLK